MTWRSASQACKVAGDELAAVVAAEVRWHPSLGHQLFHDRDEVDCRELSRHAEGQTLAGVFVEDREDAQLAPVVGAVTEEVPSPDVVYALCFGGDREPVALKICV